MTNLIEISELFKSCPNNSDSDKSVTNCYIMTVSVMLKQVLTNLTPMHQSLSQVVNSGSKLFPTACGQTYCRSVPTGLFFMRVVEGRLA